MLELPRRPLDYGVECGVEVDKQLREDLVVGIGATVASVVTGAIVPGLGL